jgi:YVTN family beta-propeller protein
VRAFLAAVMAKDPADRPESALVVGRALQGIQEAHGLPMTELRLDRGDEPAPPAVLHARSQTAPRPPPPGTAPAPSRPPLSLRRKVLISVGGVALLALIGGGVAVAIASAGDDGEPATGPTGLPVSDEFAVTDQISVGDTPEGVAVGEGAVWVANAVGQTLSRVDPATNEVTDTIELDAEPRDVAVGEGAVWIVDGDRQGLTRLDPATLEPDATMSAGTLPASVVVGEGSVWVSDQIGNRVFHVDPATNEAVAAIAVGNQPDSIAVGEGSVWVANEDDGTVTRIDPDTDQVAATLRLGPPGHAAVAVGDGALWAVNTEDSTVSRVDLATNEVTDTIELDHQPYDVIVVGDDVWVTLDDLVSAIRIDAATAAPVDEVEDVAFAGELAADDGVIWVTRGGSDVLTRIDPR